MSIMSIRNQQNLEYEQTISVILKTELRIFRKVTSITESTVICNRISRVKVIFHSTGNILHVHGMVCRISLWSMRFFNSSFFDRRWFSSTNEFQTFLQSVTCCLQWPLKSASAVLTLSYSGFLASRRSTLSTLITTSQTFSVIASSSSA